MNQESTESLETTCAICLQNIHENGQILTCTHSFHTSCLVTWLHISATCPLCRMSLEEEKAEMLNQSWENVAEFIQLLKQCIINMITLIEIWWMRKYYQRQVAIEQLPHNSWSRRLRSLLQTEWCENLFRDYMTGQKNWQACLMTFMFNFITT